MRDKNHSKGKKIIKGRTVEVHDNADINKSLRKLKKKMEESKVLEDVRKKEYYEKPSAQRKRAKAAAKARYRKKIEKSSLPQKPY